LIEQFVKARDASTLSELDQLFYETDGSGAVEYIRAHLNDFVAD